MEPSSSGAAVASSEGPFTREPTKPTAHQAGPYKETKLRWKRLAIDTLLAVLGITLITGIIAATPLVAQNSSISMFYLLAILILASTRGLYAAILASLLAVFAFGFFFVFPPFAFVLVKLRDVLTLTFFLATAVITGQLTSKLRYNAEQAQQRERDMRRLYQQAQELAALQERQRLARELHDSVSQALYGISLGAHTAREALESSDQDQERASLEYVIGLADAGLAEMRALIFELRPESLATEGLTAALMKQVAVLRARYHLTVEADLAEDGDLSLEQREALYRIAQEALHNIVKHAHASTVLLRLAYHHQEIILDIRDNGRGFDPRASFPGHLGLSSMQERAERLGGILIMESTPGQGTHIRVRVSPQP
jgi:signal transduction histidine kinase